jgi:hypothetical protein
MTFLPSLALWQWAILAAVPVGIVLLYFLKLRRQPVTVPSTYLWRKSIEDLHVNSLLQRLKTSPLLWLQLLAILLATLALFRPGFHDVGRSKSRRIFLLDASASMQATDASGFPNRFEQARKLIGDEIDAMSDQDVAMLMTVSDRVDVLQAFTSDRRRLRDALTRAAVTNRPINIQAAIRAAEGLSSPRRNEDQPASDNVATDVAVPNSQLVLYSDGGFEDLSSVDLSQLNPSFVRIGSNNVSNLAIIAFSAQRREGQTDELEAFATIANLGTTELSSSVSLRMNGELIDADEVTLKPGDEKGLSFELADADLVRLNLTLDAADQLSIDNTAYATLAPTRTASVLLVTSGNKPLELALSTGESEKTCVLEVVDPSYLKTEPYKARASTGVDQLILFDRCQPEVMPMTNTFMIGAIPMVGWKWSEKASQVLLVDIDRTHPIMRYLDLFTLLIAEGRTLEPPKGATDLLTAESGPVLSLAPREGFEDLVLGFEIISTSSDGGLAFNTDWQVQRSWPVFVFNCVRYLTGASDMQGRMSHLPGTAVTVSTERRRGELTVRDPAGNVTSVTPDPTGRITHAVDDQTGIYEVEDEKRIIDLFSVNLFDRRESTIAAPETVKLGYVEIAGEDGRNQSRNEYWRLLLILMLTVLAAEWWYYGRRLAI